jgi:hypothetical protein
LGDGGVIWFVIRRQHAVADKKFNNHEVAFEPEVEGVAHPFGDRLNGPEREALRLVLAF